jgi:hypothetical protein
MIKSVIIKNDRLYHWQGGKWPWQVEDGEGDYVQVRFTDGTFANLDEEELKNAAMLAEKGCLHA